MMSFVFYSLAFWHGKIIIIQDIVFCISSNQQLLFMLFRCEGQLRFYVFAWRVVGVCRILFYGGFLVIHVKMYYNWVKKFCFLI